MAGETIGNMKYVWKVDNKMKWSGETDTDKGVVKINKTRSRHKAGKTIKYSGKKYKTSIIDTIVHEKMHVDHPKMHEKTVYKKTPMMVKGLTPQEKAKLYKLVK